MFGSVINFKNFSVFSHRKLIPEGMRDESTYDKSVRSLNTKSAFVYDSCNLVLRLGCEEFNSTRPGIGRTRTICRRALILLRVCLMAGEDE